MFGLTGFEFNQSDQIEVGFDRFNMECSSSDLAVFELWEASFSG
jgi:hypothetical protein